MRRGSYGKKAHQIVAVANTMPAIHAARPLAGDQAPVLWRCSTASPSAVAAKMLGQPDHSATTRIAAATASPTATAPSRRDDPDQPHCPTGKAMASPNKAIPTS